MIQFGLRGYATWCTGWASHETECRLRPIAAIRRPWQHPVALVRFELPPASAHIRIGVRPSAKTAQYAHRSSSPSFGPSISPRALRGVGSKCSRAPARTRREHLAGNASASGRSRICIRRSRSDRRNLHAHLRTEPAAQRKAPRILGERCNSPRVTRPRSRRGCGAGSAGTRMGDRLPPRSDAERSSGSPRPCLLRGAGFQARASCRLRRNATDTDQGMTASEP